MPSHVIGNKAAAASSGATRRLRSIRLDLRDAPSVAMGSTPKGLPAGPFIKAGKALFCNHGACAEQKATRVLRGYGWSGLKQHISGEDSPRHRAAAQEELTAAKRQNLTNLLDPAGYPIEGWLVGTIVAAEDAVQPPPSVQRKRAAAAKEVEVSHAITDCFIGRNCQSIFLGNTGCWPRTQHDQA